MALYCFLLPTFVVQADCHEKNIIKKRQMKPSYKMYNVLLKFPLLWYNMSECSAPPGDPLSILTIWVTCVGLVDAPTIYCIFSHGSSFPTMGIIVSDEELLTHRVCEVCCTGSYLSREAHLKDKYISTID